jgi:probable phosphomutase (TIGR03848 family)
MPASRKPEPYTHICFVRHGTTPTTGKVLPGRAPGLHLSDEGRQEAREVAERLAALGTVRALYSSPIERTRETAEEIGARLGLAPTLDDALLDCDCGDWTGMSLAALRKTTEWKGVSQNPSSFRFPRGESFRELEYRVGEAIERLAEKHSGEVIVVVSHADPIKVAVARALGAPLDLFDRAAVRPCSATVIAYGPGAPCVLTVNTFGPLAKVGVPSRAAKSSARHPRATEARPKTR